MGTIWSYSIPRLAAAVVVATVFLFYMCPSADAAALSVGFQPTPSSLRGRHSKGQVFHHGESQMVKRCGRESRSSTLMSGFLQVLGRSQCLRWGYCWDETTEQCSRPTWHIIKLAPEPEKPGAICPNMYPMGLQGAPESYYMGSGFTDETCTARCIQEKLIVPEIMGVSIWREIEGTGGGWCYCEIVGSTYQPTQVKSCFMDQLPAGQTGLCPEYEATDMYSDSWEDQGTGYTMESCIAQCVGYQKVNPETNGATLYPGGQCYCEHNASSRALQHSCHFEE